MYECFGMHDDWQFVDTISQRQTKHWNIGHVMARARTCLQEFLFWGCSRSKIHRDQHLKVGSCKIVEKNGPNGVAACWNSHVSASDIASVVNAFACFFLFSLFLSSSHFCLDRPFGFSIHRGIVFFYFICPYFCLNCLRRLSIHRGAHFCLSRSFGFST